jgi:hypothetical protein
LAWAGKYVGAALAFPCLLAACQAQGTMTFAFEGQPRGTRSQLGTYTNSGMLFSVIGSGSLYLSGGGIAGYPDNGTGYLEIPDAFLGGGGVRLVQTSGASFPFDLVSFDAAVFADLGPQTLEVVGYRPQDGTVTNYFSISGQAFQTFHLDSSFVDLYRVDFLTARWSLDNLVFSTAPEPSSGGLLILGLVCALGRRRFRGKRG